MQVQGAVNILCEAEYKELSRFLKAAALSLMQLILQDFVRKGIVQLRKSSRDIVKGGNTKGIRQVP